MIYLLLDRKNMTARELSEHFEVSVRTVYRDVETLSEAGIPVYAVKGKNGGIRLTENFVLNKSVLTEEEQKKILQSLYGMHAVRKEEAEPVLSRLSALFGGEMEDWIEIEFSTWNRENPVSRRFDLLKKAIFSRQMVTFCYSGADGRTGLRRAEPLKLVFRASDWYLYAFCVNRQDFRFFKLSRMEELRLTQESFQRRRVPELRKGKEEGEQVCRGRLTDIRVQVAPQMAYRILEEFQRDSVTKLEDGSFQAKLVLPDDDWMYQYLLSFGSSLKVLSPKEIRDRHKEELKKALELYENMTD